MGTRKPSIIFWFSVRKTFSLLSIFRTLSLIPSGSDSSRSIPTRRVIPEDRLISTWFSFDSSKITSQITSSRSAREASEWSKGTDLESSYYCYCSLDQAFSKEYRRWFKTKCWKSMVGFGTSISDSTQMNPVSSTLNVSSYRYLIDTGWGLTVKHVHLHVISNDMLSDRLKNKKYVFACSEYLSVKHRLMFSSVRTGIGTLSILA